MAELKGWAFPVEVDPVTGRIMEVSEDTLIEQSIALILTVKKGERWLRPDFGCNLYRFMFNSVDYTMLKEIENEIKRCLEKWEKRIRIAEVKAAQDELDPNRVLVEIIYTTGFREMEQNYIHTFYLR